MPPLWPIYSVLYIFFHSYFRRLFNYNQVISLIFELTPFGPFQIICYQWELGLTIYLSIFFWPTHVLLYWDLVFLSMGTITCLAFWFQYFDYDEEDYFLSYNPISHPSKDLYTFSNFPWIPLTLLPIPLSLFRTSIWSCVCCLSLSLSLSRRIPCPRAN